MYLVKRILLVHDLMSRSQPRLACLLAFLFLASPVLAQPHMSGGGMSGFVAPVVKFSAVDGSTGFFLGARGGLILAIGENRGLVIGGGMYGLMSAIPDRYPEPGERPENLQFGYGGLELEYVWQPDDLVHVSAVTLLGMGMAGRGKYDGYGHGWSGGPALFIVEPGANLSLKAGSYLRVSLGAGYRLAGITSSTELRAGDLSGWSGLLALKLGRF